MNLHILKLGLLLFWTIWFTLVFITNTFEALKRIKILPESWKFVSKNYELIADTTAIYSVPEWVNQAMFLGVILWQAAAVVLFWIAFIASAQVGGLVVPGINSAFTASLSLWAAFILADEVFRHYQGERSHLSIFIAQLVTLMVLYLA